MHFLHEGTIIRSMCQGSDLFRRGGGAVFTYFHSKRVVFPVPIFERKMAFTAHLDPYSQG